MTQEERSKQGLQVLLGQWQMRAAHYGLCYIGSAFTKDADAWRNIVTFFLPLQRGEERACDVADYGSFVVSQTMVTISDATRILEGVVSSDLLELPNVPPVPISVTLNVDAAYFWDSSDRRFPLEYAYTGYQFGVGDAYRTTPPGSPLLKPDLPLYSNGIAAIRDRLNIDFGQNANYNSELFGLVPEYSGRFKDVVLGSRTITIGVDSPSLSSESELLIKTHCTFADGSSQSSTATVNGASTVIPVKRRPQTALLVLIKRTGERVDQRYVHEQLDRTSQASILGVLLDDQVPSDCPDDPKRSEVQPDLPAVGFRDLPTQAPLFVSTNESLTANAITSVVFMDLDGFKAVNDGYGHAAGDGCLENVVKLVGNVVLKKGELFRYGGDEFVVLLPNFDSAEATATAERIRKAIDEGNPGYPARVTASIGVASSDERSDLSGEELIALADKAMYASKNSGKNRVSARSQIFDSVEKASSTWEGADWENTFIAIEGPGVLSLPKIEDQYHEVSMEKSLVAAGFSCMQADLADPSPTLAQGFRIAWITDRTSYRARVTLNNQHLLVARRQSKQVATAPLSCSATIDE